MSRLPDRSERSGLLSAYPMVPPCEEHCMLLLRSYCLLSNFSLYTCHRGHPSPLFLYRLVQADIKNRRLIPCGWIKLLCLVLCKIPGDFTVRVVQVSKDPCPSYTSLNT